MFAESDQNVTQDIMCGNEGRETKNRETVSTETPAKPKARPGTALFVVFSAMWALALWGYNLYICLTNTWLQFGPTAFFEPVSFAQLPLWQKLLHISGLWGGMVTGPRVILWGLFAFLCFYATRKKGLRFTLFTWLCCFGGALAASALLLLVPGHDHTFGDFFILNPLLFTAASFLGIALLSAVKWEKLFRQ